MSIAVPTIVLLVIVAVYASAVCASYGMEPRAIIKERALAWSLTIICLSLATVGLVVAVNLAARDLTC